MVAPSGQKRLHACGEGVDYLPPIGTHTRTYAAGQCLHATIKQYNTTTNTCILVPDGSRLEITTTIAKTSSSAVRQNGLTADETNTVNHVLERLTDNTLTNTTEWKPYGTVASVQTLHGEPHVTIVRKNDAATEEQPLVDVIDADMMRLGKQITNKQTTRGRDQNRYRGRRNRNKRGGAPHRKSKRTNPKSTGGNPQETVSPGGASPGLANPE